MMDLSLILSNPIIGFAAIAILLYSLKIIAGKKKKCIEDFPRKFPNDAKKVLYYRFYISKLARADLSYFVRASARKV